MKKIILTLIILTLSGCYYPSPNWLLIEYPIEKNTSTMRFPGAEANTLQECIKIANMVKKMRNENYEGKFQCGSNCRFLIDYGSPFCDELIDL